MYPSTCSGRGRLLRSTPETPINRTTTFLLLIQKDEAGAVVQLQIALDRPTFDKDGQALVTPAVATADEFESAVNALQAELDKMRVQGRRLLCGRN